MNDGDSNTMAQPARLYYLDWLRVLLVGLVFLGHSLMPFNSASDWAVMNEYTAFLPAGIVGYLYQWVMPLFFVVSGASAALSLQRAPAGRFVSRRILRLAVPYLFGVLTLSPVHDYYSDRNHGVYEGSFLAYLPQFYGSARWDWSLSFGLSDNHLWFLQYLFWFSIAALPLLLWLRGARGQALATRAAVVAGGPSVIFVLALPVALAQACLRPGFHAHTGWSDAVVWFIFFLGGFLLVLAPRIQGAIARWWPLGAFIGAACMAATAVLFKLGYVEDWELHPHYSAAAMGYEALRGLNTCAWVIFYLGGAMRWCTTGPRMLIRANEGVLPFYMLHQVALVVAGYYLLPWAPPLLPAWITLAVLAFLGSVGTYALLIYPFYPLRRAFGLQPKPTRLAQPPAPA